VYAAGDVREGSIGRVVTAAADGAAAVAQIHHYLDEQKPGRANPAARGPADPVAVAGADDWMDAMDSLDRKVTGAEGRANPPAGFGDAGPVHVEALGPGDVFQDQSGASFRVDKVTKARGGKVRLHLTRPAHGKVPEQPVGGHSFEPGGAEGFHLLKRKLPLASGLDFYKATMSQVQWRNHPDTQVTFAFHEPLEDHSDRGLRVGGRASG